MAIQSRVTRSSLSYLNRERRGWLSNGDSRPEGSAAIQLWVKLLTAV